MLINILFFVLKFCKEWWEIAPDLFKYPWASGAFGRSWTPTYTIPYHTIEMPLAWPRFTWPNFKYTMKIAPNQCFSDKGPYCCKTQSFLTIVLSAKCLANRLLNVAHLSWPNYCSAPIHTLCLESNFIIRFHAYENMYACISTNMSATLAYLFFNLPT